MGTKEVMEALGDYTDLEALEGLEAWHIGQHWMLVGAQGKLTGPQGWHNWWLIELPMWLTDGFLVTFFGRWMGAVCIHVSHAHT